ncbi:hypothetical protein T484DRAFT_1863243, partial [Baffinella frigidus]
MASMDNPSDDPWEVVQIPYADWANGVTSVNKLRLAVEPYNVTYTSHDAEDVVLMLRTVVTFGEALTLEDVHSLRRCWCVLTSSELWQHSDDSNYVDRLFGLTDDDMTYVRYFLDQYLVATDLYKWEQSRGARHTHGISFCVKNYSKIADRALLIRLLRAYAMAYPASLNERFLGANWYDRSYALHELANCPDIEPLRTLLEAGATTCVEDIDGRTPIYNMVCHRLDSVERVRLMHSYGLDITHIDTNMDNIFHHAVRYQHVEMISALLELRNLHLDPTTGAWEGPRGAKNQLLGDHLHQLNGYFNSPLYVALENRRATNLHMMEILIDAGSDPDLSLRCDGPAVGKISRVFDGLDELLEGSAKALKLDKQAITVIVRKPDCFVFVRGTAKTLQECVCAETSSQPTQIVGVEPGHVFKAMRPGTVFKTSTKPGPRLDIPYYVRPNLTCVPGYGPDAYRSSLDFWVRDESVNTVSSGTDLTVRYVLNKRRSGLHNLTKNGVFGCPALRSLFRCNPLLRDADGKTAADLLEKHVRKFPIENPRAQQML